MTKPLISGRDRHFVRRGSRSRALEAARASKNVATEATDLRPLQLVFLAAAVFVVSAGYGAMMPLLPAWLLQQMPESSASEVARHVGFLSGAYTFGVVVAAPIWGWISDHLGRPRVLMVGLVGYVASLLLLLVPMDGLWTIYMLRAAAGVFVAAVVPVVPALISAHTPSAQRARRFAWLGAASLLGFLFGPGLNTVADGLATLITKGAALAPLSAHIVIVLSAVLGAAMMLGLAMTLPAHEIALETETPEKALRDRTGIESLWWLSIAVMFVLSGFELGIVLQGGQHTNLTTQQVAYMFAECSLVMLAVNALLFFTSLLDKIPARIIIAAGSVIAMSGLAMLALHQSNECMYIGVSLTSAGTGLILPVIAFLAAGAATHRLGTTMGSLATAAGLGQTLGSLAGGWLFGAMAQLSFAWLALPLLLTLILLLCRPAWWADVAALPVTGAA